MIETATDPRKSVAFAAASEAPPTVSEATLPWAALPGGVVDGGEIVILAIKPSMWKPVFDSATWLVAACLMAAVLTRLGAALPGLSLTSTAQLVLLAGFARLGIAVFRWVPTWHVLTNRRIIDIHGVRAPAAVSCPLIDIRNTYLRPSPAEKLLGLGSILFISKHDGDQPRAWRCISRPDDVHARIRRAIEQAIDQHGAA
jgi:hypothetical protein